jgi:hypothetical protein
MTRKAPPPRPRGAPAPHYVATIDGRQVFVVGGRAPQPPPDWLPRREPGPDYTAGEKMFVAFFEAFDSQRFDYVQTESGDLRQYWCPRCGKVTAAVTFQCERCGEWFHAGEIEDQVDKPDVRIPYAVVEFLAEAFDRIMHGENPRDALKLKAGTKRTTQPQYYLQSYAAILVHRKLVSMSKSKACEEVAGELADRMPKGELDPRTVANWYDKFYPPEK